MACELQLARLTSEGNDVLVATGRCRVHGLVEARGWVSATTNHFEPEAYAADGHLSPDAIPRAMRPAEVAAYGLRLLTEAHPTETVLFEDQAVVDALAAAAEPPVVEVLP